MASNLTPSQAQSLASAATLATSSANALGALTTVVNTLAGGVVASVSTSPSGNTNLLNPAGGVIATIPASVGVQGPPGMLGQGSASANTVSTRLGGPGRTLGACQGARLRLADFGAAGNATTAHGLLGVATRAALAGWTNESGATPYAFAATQPFTMGDDNWVRIPLATASGSSVALAQTLTLPAAAYQGIDGNWYVPTPTSAGTTYSPGMAVTGPGIAAASTVVCTQGDCFRLSPQPSGFSLASGTTITIGADMTRIAVGQQVWATQGLAPLCTITSISGSTITLSESLTSGTDPIGRSYTGLGQLQAIVIYTPMSEATLTNSVTMDMLAVCAAYVAAPNQGVIEVDPGYYDISPHIILAGKAVSIVGAAAKACFLQGTDSSTLLKLFPAPYTNSEIRNIDFASYNGAPPSYLEIDGAGFDVPAVNAGIVAVQIDNIGGFSAGNPVPANRVGAYELVRMRNLGGCRFDNIDFSGLGKGVPGTCALNVANVVLLNSRNVGAGNISRNCIQTGYVEHPICRDWTMNQCGGGWDMANASTFVSYACLLFDWSGGDTDVSEFILNLVLATDVSITGCNLQLNGAAAGATCFRLAGCDHVTIAGLNGTTGSPGASAIHLTSASIDGFAPGCSRVRVAATAVEGFGQAVLIDAGSSGNIIDADLWSYALGATGISATPVVDNAGGNRVNGVMTSAPA